MQKKILIIPSKQERDFFCPWVNERNPGFDYLPQRSVQRLYYTNEWMKKTDFLLRLLYKLHIISPEIVNAICRYRYTKKLFKQYRLVVLVGFLFDEFPYFDLRVGFSPKWLKKKLAVYCWDSLSDRRFGAQWVAKVRQYAHAVYSFQPEDCKTYGLRFNTQYYCKPPFPITKDSDTKEILFLGHPKGRLLFLLHIHDKLQAHGFEPNFLLLDHNRFSYQKTPFGLQEETEYMECDRRTGITIIEEKMDYSADYIPLLQESSAVLDVYMEGQTGFSLRVMEHMFFSKKLITTNALVRQADFYNPANIFVYGEDDITTLKAWLDIPFEPVPEEIKDYYTVERWAERFDE